MEPPSNHKIPKTKLNVIICRALMSQTILKAPRQYDTYVTFYYKTVGILQDIWLFQKLQIHF